MIVHVINFFLRSRKQYYSRIAVLLKAGLIKRCSKSYSVSSLGKIVYCAPMIIGKALEYYWKPAAIDSVQYLPGVGLDKIIQSLIDNSQIEELLVRDVYDIVTENSNNINNNSNSRGKDPAKNYAYS
jgi:predicted transcriptional regulator